MTFDDATGVLVRLEDAAVESLLRGQFGAGGNQLEQGPGQRIELSHLPCALVRSGS